MSFALNRVCGYADKEIIIACMIDSCALKHMSTNKINEIGSVALLNIEVKVKMK